MSKKVKFGKKQFYKSTPKRIQEIADAVKATCVLALGYSFVSDNSKLMVSIVGVMLVSDLVSRLFGESNDKS